MWKEFKSQRIFLVHQHGRHFIFLEHQYGRHDVKWKRSVACAAAGPRTRLNYLHFEKGGR